MEGPTQGYHQEGIMMNARRTTTAIGLALLLFNPAYAVASDIAITPDILLPGPNIEIVEHITAEPDILLPTSELATPVPEPSTWMMMGLGLAVAGLFVSRRKASDKS
jgi:hypothetical protein